MTDGDSVTPRHPVRRLPGFDYATADHAYFVTICTAERASSFTDPRLATMVVDALLWRRQHGIGLHAYCVMPDHLHLLLTLGSSGLSLSALLRAFKSYTTRLSWGLGYQGQLWQARFHDHILRQAEDGRAIGVYILANPVRAGLVDDPEAYPWSGSPDPL